MLQNERAGYTARVSSIYLLQVILPSLQVPKPLMGGVSAKAG